GFDYAGNPSVDFPVWAQARQAIVVNAGAQLTQRARKCSDVVRVFELPDYGRQSLIRALRPHQWVKNLIIFVPLLTSHKLNNLNLTLDGLVAFIAFCFCASAVYVLNDLLDLDFDRHHPTKRFRSFAAGKLAIPVGMIAVPVLLLASAVLALRLSWSFAIVLGLYLILTTSYSWRLKHVPLLDVFW